MYIHFRYRNGSNPYISTTTENLFKMICKYDLRQTGAADFMVVYKREPYKKNYKALQEVLRNFAVEWQYMFSELCYSWGDLAEWSAFFEEYGKKYGLLREFRENGII